MAHGSTSAAALRARVASASWLPTVGPFRAFAQRWRFKTTDPAMAQHLGNLYAAARDDEWGPSTGCVTYGVLPVEPDAPGVVARDGEVLVERRTPASLMRRLVWTVNRQVIDRSQDRLLLHAAAVRFGAEGVLLPADMEAGKTTLATGLIDRGATYLTDEAAAVTGDLLIEGFGKPLSIDAGSWSVLAQHEPRLPPDLAIYHRRQWQVPPPRTARTAGLTVIVFPAYEAGAATRLESLKPTDALERAVACTFAPEGATVPTSKVRTLAKVVASVSCYSLVSGELDAACQAILDVMSDRNEAGTALEAETHRSQEQSPD